MFWGLGSNAAQNYGLSVLSYPFLLSLFIYLLLVIYLKIRIYTQPERPGIVNLFLILGCCIVGLIGNVAAIAVLIMNPGTISNWPLGKLSFAIFLGPAALFYATVSVARKIVITSKGTPTATRRVL